MYSFRISTMLAFFCLSTPHPSSLRQNHSSFWFLPSSLSNIPVMFMAWHIL